MTEATLLITGNTDQSIAVTRETIRSKCAGSIIDDVSSLEAKRVGVGIRISELIQLAAPINATQLTMHSTDGFSATLPLEIASDGILIFELDGQSLIEAAGGPFRFFTIDSAECGTAVADHCANVKCIERIELV